MKVILNKSILFTGTLQKMSRDRAKELAKKKGYKIASNVSKNLDILVSGDKSGSEAELIHQGISKRYFKKVFTLSNDVEVRSAQLKDGLLRISMERVIPDEMKRKEIEIV